MPLWSVKHKELSCSSSCQKSLPMREGVPSKLHPSRSGLRLWAVLRPPFLGAFQLCEGQQPVAGVNLLPQERYGWNRRSVARCSTRGGRQHSQLALTTSNEDAGNRMNEGRRERGQDLGEETRRASLLLVCSLLLSLLSIYLLTLRRREDYHLVMRMGSHHVEPRLGIYEPSVAGKPERAKMPLLNGFPRR